ncbi:MAG: hypothetical protein ABR573_04335 [Candidatus Dormibacteria bacterium]
MNTAPSLAKDHDPGTAAKPAASSSSSGHDSAGDNNAGDVWTDNVGQPSGPGHEQDPHLACTDINLWGAKMADPSGSYAIDSIPPSGRGGVVYTSTWRYNQAQGGVQVISVIPVHTLVANAQAAGATPQNKNGYHFKLDLSQDPQKHKTFWVDCPAPAPTSVPPTVVSHTEGSGGTGVLPVATTEGTPGTEGNGLGAGGAVAGVSTENGTVSPAGEVLGASTVAPRAAVGTSASAGAVLSSKMTQPVGGVLGAATSMPTTGRGLVAGGLLAALAMIVAGALMVRQSRTS